LPGELAFLADPGFIGEPDFCRSIPPAFAASARLAPSITKAKDNIRREAADVLALLAKRRNSAAE
jgi:hypothetical protein